MIPQPNHNYNTLSYTTSPPTKPTAKMLSNSQVQSEYDYAAWSAGPFRTVPCAHFPALRRPYTRESDYVVLAQHKRTLLGAVYHHNGAEPPPASAELVQSSRVSDADASYPHVFASARPTLSPLTIRKCSLA